MTPKQVYKYLAKEHNVSVRFVKHRMQVLIDREFKAGNPEILDIPRARNKPTIAEFFAYYHVFLDDEF